MSAIRGFMTLVFALVVGHLVFYGVFAASGVATAYLSRFGATEPHAGTILLVGVIGSLIAAAYTSGRIIA